MNELDIDVISEAKILLAFEAGLAGFSATCLVLLAGMENHNYITIFSSCMFVIAAVCFCHLIADMHQILYKPAGKHRSHLKLVGEYADIFQPVGLVCFALGFLGILLNISIFTLAIGVVAIFYASFKQLEFLRKLNRIGGDATQ